MRSTRFPESDERIQTVRRAEILEARELRYHEKQALLSRFHFPVLSVMLNIPGEEKSCPLYGKAVEYMSEHIEHLLGNDIYFRQISGSADGTYSLFAVRMDGIKLKRKMVELEENHSAGRFFDLDVMSDNGEVLSRTLLGYPPRICYICGRPAKECSALGRHPLPELRALVDKKLESYCSKSRISEVL